MARNCSVSGAAITLPQRVRILSSKRLIIQVTYRITLIVVFGHGGGLFSCKYSFLDQFEGSSLELRIRTGSLV